MKIVNTATGSAVVVMADGKEFTCQAQLWRGFKQASDAQGGTVDGLPSWGGTLVFDSPFGPSDLHDLPLPRLRIEGREGEFTEAGGTLPEIRINGSGPPPFD